MARWARVAVAALTVMAAGALPVEGAAARAAALSAATTATAVPRPDHVVVVVEENHSGAEVVGSPDAPYISSLAAQGANFTASYAVTHPSQPNYLALFSGSTQGLTDDSCPHTYSAPSLGDQLLGAGRRFVGYSESLPYAGYTGCTKNPYYRKHAPWVDFPAVPAVDNQPFSRFPTDYSTLPDVSFVIPNIQDDMHDGTVAQGDAWLQANLGGYVTWARTHNSLLVLTFDEDDYTADNHIATVIVGQQVVPGDYGEPITHYSVLRTLEDAFGLPPLGAAADAAPILDIWAAPDTPPTASFTASCTGLSCTFDASASSDPDGTITSYDWTFGDGAGAAGGGPVVTHDYAAGTLASVRLTVTDNGGATGTATQQVTVTDPGDFDSDAFGRTVTDGLGTADAGGAWALSGPAADFAVTPGQATLRVDAAPGSTGANLGATRRTSADVRTAVALAAVPVGGAVTVLVQGRRVKAKYEYDAKLVFGADRSVSVRLTRVVNGTETTLAGGVRIASSYPAGKVYAVRLQVTGTAPTTLCVKAWPAAGTEPAAWLLSATDSTASLQTSGAVGVVAKTASTVTNLPATLLLGWLRAA